MKYVTETKMTVGIPIYKTDLPILEQAAFMEDCSIPELLHDMLLKYL